MRFVIALLQHETNTFSPLPTTLCSFATTVGLETVPRTQQAIEIYGKTDFAFAAFIDFARQQNAEFTVPIAAYAEPGGKVSDEALDYFSDEICKAVGEGCDAVMLDLHGAMVSESFDDGEGELLRRIRNIDATVPIVVALDFHANLSKTMVDDATIICGYCTYPHVDMYETGERACRSLKRILYHQAQLKMSWGRVPMMTHMLKQTPSKQPMKDIMDLAIDAEKMGKFGNVSVFGGFPLADVQDVSLSVLIVSEISEHLTDSYINNFLEEILSLAWNRRAEFVFNADPLPKSIAQAKVLQGAPVLIADHGDNSGAGGSADDMTVLQEMLTQGLSGIVAGPIWDPQSVQELIDAGEGETVTVNVGGKTSAQSIGQKGQSLEITGVVSRITDGRFVISGPMQTGVNVNLGRTVVLSNSAVELFISEQRWEPYDQGCYTHANIDPRRKQYILVKSRQHFRAGFESIAKHIVLAAGPGVCSSDYEQFSFCRVKRPIFPLDIELESNQFREIYI